MKYQVRCLCCHATGWCRGNDVEGSGFEANDDDLADICSHLREGSEYEGTGEVDYDD